MKLDFSGGGNKMSVNELLQRFPNINDLKTPINDNRMLTQERIWGKARLLGWSGVEAGERGEEVQNGNEMNNKSGNIQIPGWSRLIYSRLIGSGGLGEGKRYRMGMRWTTNLEISRFQVMQAAGGNQLSDVYRVHQSLRSVSESLESLNHRGSYSSL